MNNKFKRALSSVLAFIMLCSCVVTMNVSSVFAAVTCTSTTTSVLGMTDLDYYASYDNAQAALTNSFNEGKVQINAISDGKSTSNGAIVDAKVKSINGYTYTKQLCMNKKSGTSTANRVIEIVLDGTYDIYADVCAGGERTYQLFDSDMTTVEATSASVSGATLKFEAVSKGTYYLTSPTNTWFAGAVGLKLADDSNKYAVSGGVTVSDNADLTGRTFTLGTSTATIGTDGTYTISPKLADGTYSFSANWGDYTLSGSDVTVNGADVTGANVTITAKDKYTVSGSITGATVDAGTEFTLTNKDYTDITATATVGGDGTTYSSTTELVAGTYTISGLSVENYSLTTPTITVSESGSTDIVFVTASKTTGSYQWDISGGLVKGDNGNGLYALDAMPRTDDTDVSVQGNANGSYSDNGIPSGSVLKLDSAVNGKWTITYTTGTTKAVYALHQTSDTATEVIETFTFASDKSPYTIDGKAGETYYFFGTGTRLKFKNIEFTEIETTTADAEKPAILVTAAKDAWYAIAVIASDSKTKLEKIAIDNVDTNTVYNSVTIGGTSYTAKDFGGSKDDYVFAVQGGGTPNDTATATDVQDNLTVTYTNVTTE